MLPQWIVLVFIISTTASMDPKALRPCFERYANHRLVNLQPYHSEWRMKSEERCLQFCSDTSSRCRSIVYDAVQHICHFFLDDGYDFTVPAAKMIYLKVVSGTCLETYASSSSKTSEVINFGEIPKESTTVESVSAIPTKQFVVPLTTLSSVEGDGNFTSSQNFTETPTDHSSTSEGTSTEAVQDSQLARPDRREAISDIDQEKKFGEQRWESSRKQVMETTSSSNFEDEQLHEKKNDKRTKETALSSEKKESLERKLHEKLELFKEMYPDRYVQYLLERGYAPLPFLASEIRATTPLVFGTVSPQMSKRMKFPAKRIPFSDDHLFYRKKIRAEIRRHQTSLKLVRVEPPYLTKARSFLNIVNSKKNSTTGDKGMDYQRPLDDYAVVSSDTGCLVGHVPIWLVFENSIGSESIDSSFAKDWKACREMCSDETCTSLTFFDEQQCMVNKEDDGVNLRKPPHGDYTARTDLKFCYPDNISPYHTCSDFVAFRDYTVKVEPREKFYGLPVGYDGLKLCVELCVLSSEYACKSAVFATLEGVCSLNEEDSLTAPTSFELSDTKNHLYFENGCTSQPELSSVDRSFMSIERMSTTLQTVKPPPAKILEIKPIKLQKLLNQNR